MTARTAIYYPHTHIRSASLMRTALLTWDNVEFIVPWEGFGFRYRDPEVAEAAEIITRRRCLTSEERSEVHSLLEDLLNYTPPNTLAYGSSSPDQEYTVWCRKLNPDTWHMLQQRSLAKPRDRVFRGTWQRDEDRLSVQSGIALTLMAMMADVAAGKTRTRITDEADAYATLSNLPLRVWDHEPPQADCDYVVGRTLRSVNLRNVSLRKLIELRKREERDSSLRDLRHAYLDLIDEHVRDINAHNYSTADRAELDRVFEQKVQADFQQLKREFDLPLKEVLLSQEMLSLGVAAGTALIATAIGDLSPEATLAVAGGPAILGGLLLNKTRYGAQRAQILALHPTAYLYQASKA